MDRRSGTTFALTTFQARALERAEREAHDKAYRFRSPEEKRADLTRKLLDDIAGALDHFLNPNASKWLRDGSVSRDHDVACFRSFAEAACAHVETYAFRSLGEFAAWLLESLHTFKRTSARTGLTFGDAAVCRRSIDMIYEITRFTFGIVLALYPDKGTEEVLRLAARYLSTPVDSAPPSPDGPFN